MAQEKYNVKRSGNAAPSPEKKAPVKSRRAEMERERRKEAAKTVMRRRREKRVNFVLIFIFALIFTGLYFGTVILRINKASDSSETVNELKIFRSGSKKAAATFSPEEISFNKTTYLPISFMSDFFTLTEFGDDKTYSFMIPSSGEWASFVIGTVNATVNGQSISLSSEAFMKDGTLYLPVDFYSNKMNCFEKVSFSSALNCDVMTVYDTKAPEFSSKKTESLEKIDVESVPSQQTPPEISQT